MPSEMGKLALAFFQFSWPGFLVMLRQYILGMGGVPGVVWKNRRLWFLLVGLYIRDGWALAVHCSFLCGLGRAQMPDAMNRDCFLGLL